jgi:hypothetical protein
MGNDFADERVGLRHNLSILFLVLLFQHHRVTHARTSRDYDPFSVRPELIAPH